MDLVADIGNTRVHLGAFEDGRLVAKFAGDDRDGFVASLPARPARIGVSSVNPKARAAFVEWARTKLGVAPRVVGEDLRPRLAMDVVAPEKVGTDRLVNGLWAARRHPGRAVLVVDFGTAISMAVVDSKGTFRGGVIAPGITTQARALSEKTAQLPLAKPSRAPAPIGRDTVSCIESGIFWGAVGLVDLIAGKIEESLGEKLLVVATGGDSALIAPASSRIEQVVPDLTLEGVWIALSEG